MERRVRFDANSDFFGLSFGDGVACERSEQDSNDSFEKDICCVHVEVVKYLRICDVLFRAVID
ncbi:MAG: hypothetical protein EBQ97_01275 [Bacteroidetes bacterium]|nr:hypothetical protein [Bacteroidota bacterium]